MLTQTTRQKTCCGILRKDAEARSEHELTLLAAVMREVPQFQQLDGASLRAICRTMELKRFAKGDVIVQEGDHGSEFYVLIRGAVSIFLRPEEASGQELRPRVPRCVDYTMAQADVQMPEIKAKSRAHALNRRISYTVDWDATDVNLEGEPDEAEFSRRVSAIEETRKIRGTSFTDSESEDAEDVTRMLRSAKSVLPRMTRRLSSDKEQLEEKSPRRAGLRAAALLPGSSFGEFSLLSQPRQSTAKCEEKSSVAILRRDDYQQILETTESRRRSEWMDFAQAAPILRTLDQSTRLLLEPLVKIQQVSRGQKVVKIGDPVQVLFLAKGIFEVASFSSGKADSSEAVGMEQAVPSALMAPPSCFGLSAHCRNETHFEESLTSCSAGKLYVLQTKHLWMMLSSHQQDALTRAASYERWFHLARATVMRALNRPHRPDARTRQLYAVSSRLGILRDQLQKPQDCTSEEGQGVGRMIAGSWSQESLQAVVENNSRREKLPRLEPELSRVAPAGEVPKTRLHSSLLALWSPSVLVQRRSLHLGQQQGVFHGYGPPVQANRFITQFFKVHSGPWSHACQSSASASHSSRPAQQPAARGEEEEFFEAFEDDGSMSPLLDAKIKETVRQRRLQEEWRKRAEKAAATLQSIVRRFLRHRRKQNHAASCIQRAFRSRHTLETSSIADTPLATAATPSPTPEAEHHPLCLGFDGFDEGKHTLPDPDQTSTARHGSILHLDLDTGPKLQDLKKALGRGNHRSWRSKPSQEVAPTESAESSLCLVKLPKAEVPPLFVPLDLIEKHRLLMETQVLDEWPNADRLPALKRLRRNWEKLQRKPPTTTEVVVAPTDLADLGAWKLPVLPSPKGTMVFSARLSAAHPADVSDWNREREMEKDEIDPSEIYRPKPAPPRFRSTLRRYG